MRTVCLSANTPPLSTSGPVPACSGSKAAGLLQRFLHQSRPGSAPPGTPCCRNGRRRYTFYFQHRADTVDGQRLPFPCPQALRVEMFDNLLLGVPILLGVPSGVHLKDAPNQRRGLRIRLQILVRSRPIPQRERTAHTLPLAGHIVHAPLDIGGQLNGIVFRHPLQNRLQNDALWGIRDTLRSIEYLDAVLFASIFFEGDLFPVAPKAVDLPDNDRLKLVLCRVLQHLLELLPVVISACLCPVDILMDGWCSCVLRRIGRQRPTALQWTAPPACG